MEPSTKAYLVEEAGRMASSIIRVVMSRPRKRPPIEEEVPLPAHTEITQTKPTVEATIPVTTYTPVPPRTQGEEVGYRFECCMKHLGGANVLLREAYERAIDEGIGEGTAEKIMEALNEHAGMESDLEKMLAIPEAKAQAEKLLSGVRAFRKATWEAKLPTGNGTKEDIADARLWNDILYQETFASAKQQPGKECVREGM